jgi:hypothetical protein
MLLPNIGLTKGSGVSEAVAAAQANRRSTRVKIDFLQPGELWFMVDGG